MPILQYRVSILLFSNQTLLEIFNKEIESNCHSYHKRDLNTQRYWSIVSVSNQSHFIIDLLPRDVMLTAQRKWAEENCKVIIERRKISNETLFV